MPTETRKAPKVRYRIERRENLSTRVDIFRGTRMVGSCGFGDRAVVWRVEEGQFVVPLQHRDALTVLAVNAVEGTFVPRR